MIFWKVFGSWTTGWIMGGTTMLVLTRCHRFPEPERRGPPSWDSGALEQCAQSEQVCNAVAQQLGITLTIPPWQAMVLTPILDPR